MVPVCASASTTVGSTIPGDGSANVLVLLGFLLVILGLFSVLLGFSLVLHGFTLVLLGFTPVLLRFILVLLGFYQFYSLLNRLSFANPLTAG
jgi:hypothetical protein